MKPLPRPVREVLDEPVSPASVMRVWARVQVKRRAPTPLARPWLVGVAAVAAVALVVVTRPRPAVGSMSSGEESVAPVTKSMVAASETKERVAPAPVVAEVKAPPRVGPWLQGRHSLATFSRPLVKADGVPADLVGSLLESAEDAWRAGQPARVVAILGEVSEHHADDPRASEALFFLGLVQLDAMKHPRLAKASFQRALELNPPTDLVVPLWEAYQRSMDEGSASE
ncbi:MAG: tetratricopeptide repeat protein [Myxococcales bacterium]|nr:tetratricopeptide repeat protein [Myxococcales bacterium]